MMYFLSSELPSFYAFLIWFFGMTGQFLRFIFKFPVDTKGLTVGSLIIQIFVLFFLAFDLARILSKEKGTDK